MDEPQSPQAPRRRVGVYERLRGPAGASPARKIGIGMVLLAIIVIIVLVLAKYW
jgi:hypothetical protein